VASVQAKSGCCCGFGALPLLLGRSPLKGQSPSIAVLVGALPLLRPSRFKGAKPPQTTATTTTAFGSASNHPQVVRAKSTEGYFLVFYNNVYIQKARASR
jgi:hypothetical protein